MVRRAGRRAQALHFLHEEWQQCALVLYGGFGHGVEVGLVGGASSFGHHHEAVFGSLRGLDVYLGWKVAAGIDFLIHGERGVLGVTQVVLRESVVHATCQGFLVLEACPYLLSLLAMDDGRSCILAERQYSLASHLGVAQELQSHILVVLGCFRVGQNLGHLLIVLAAQHELHVMECLLAEQGKCLGGDFHYLLALEFANAHSLLCEQAVLGVVFAHLEHGGVLEIRCCHN